MSALIKDLAIGSKVKLVDPPGVAVVQRKEPSRLFHAVGGCFALDLRVVDGEHKGKTIRDQHHAGNDEVELA